MNLLKLHKNNVVSILLLFLCLLLLTNCKKQEKLEKIILDLPQIVERDTLIVATLENSLSYFTYGEEEFGYDYKLCSEFANTIGVNVKVLVADNLEDLRQILLKQKCDLIAYRMPKTQENKALLSFTENSYSTYPVLIQHKTDSITMPTDLIGRSVYVRKYSRYWELLTNLNNELGGGIKIMEVDSLNVDQLIVAVGKKEIPLTIADNEIALLNREYVENIDINVALGVAQEYGWAVRQTSPLLLQSINEWYEGRKKYNEKLKLQQRDANKYFEIKNVGKMCGISPYDSLFMKYAQDLSWDWRLLASVAYHESRFNPNTISYAGASGLMQLMPITAEKLGLDSVSIFDPEKSIAASVVYIQHLYTFFKKIPDSQERTKFVLASYNSGPAHVLDAMDLAEKYGDNRDIWFNSVERYLLLKSQPEYYNDEVCRFGYFRGNHTVRYVKDVFETYQKYCGANVK